MLEGHHLVLGVLTSVLFTAALTNLIKCPVGRFRPDFNARCVCVCVGDGFVFCRKIMPPFEMHRELIVFRSSPLRVRPALPSAATAAALAPAVAECDRKCVGPFVRSPGNPPVGAILCCA